MSICFEDGARYEASMGVWSRLAGEIFLEWLAPRTAWRWLDVGCGNGAFTRLIAERCQPTEIHGIDPSEGQLAFARTSLGGRATLRRGDAMSLPYSDGTFDVAVMALVVVFVPDPARGVQEMTRVVRPGGAVAAYVWDMQGSGFPLHPITDTLSAMGFASAQPPRPAASSADFLQRLWQDAGLQAVQPREIVVTRTFADFDEYWSAGLASATLAPVIAQLGPRNAATLKERVRIRLHGDRGRPIVCHALANAIRGVRPA